MKKTLFVAIAVLAMVMGVVAYASAAGSTVTVNAKVGSKITLAVADEDESVLLEALPGAMAVDTATINVRSNIGYNLTRTSTGEITGSGLPFTAEGATGTGFPKAPAAGGFDHTETFTLDLSDESAAWADPADLTEVFTYSVVPNP